jgi:hypothetical protein
MPRTWLDVVAGIGFAMFGICLILVSAFALALGTWTPLWWLAMVVGIALAYLAFGASLESWHRPTSGFSPARLIGVLVLVLMGVAIIAMANLVAGTA